MVLNINLKDYICSDYLCYNLSLQLSVREFIIQRECCETFKYKIQKKITTKLLQKYYKIITKLLQNYYKNITKLAKKDN